MPPASFGQGRLRQASRLFEPLARCFPNEERPFLSERMGSCRDTFFQRRVNGRDVISIDEVLDEKFPVRRNLNLYRFVEPRFFNPECGAK